MYKRGYLPGDDTDGCRGLNIYTAETGEITLPIGVETDINWIMRDGKGNIRVAGQRAFVAPLVSVEGYWTIAAGQSRRLRRAYIC